MNIVHKLSKILILTFVFMVGCRSTPAPIFADNFFDKQKYQLGLTMYSGTMVETTQLHMANTIPVADNINVSLILPLPGWPVLRGNFGEYCISSFCLHGIVDASYWQLSYGISDSGTILNKYGTTSGGGFTGYFNYEKFGLQPTVRLLISTPFRNLKKEIAAIPVLNVSGFFGSEKAIIADLEAYYKKNHFYVGWTLGGQF